MPFYPTTEAPDYEQVSVGAKTAPDQKFAAAYMNGLERDSGFFGGTIPVVSGVAASVSDLVDTASSSIGLTDRPRRVDAHEGNRLRRTAAAFVGSRLRGSGESLPELHRGVQPDHRQRQGELRGRRRAAAIRHCRDRDAARRSRTRKALGLRLDHRRADDAQARRHQPQERAAAVRLHPAHRVRRLALADQPVSRCCPRRDPPVRSHGHGRVHPRRVRG